MLATLLSLLALVCLLIAFVQTGGGQNWLARQVTARLSKDLQSRIEIKRVNIGLFDKLNLEGVLIEDRKKDTLLYAGTVQVLITDWFFVKDKAVLEYIGLKDAVVQINRTDSVWNYQHLVDYFSPPPTGKPKKAGIEFDLKKVLLENVSILQKDAWVGSDMTVRFGALELDARELSLTGKRFDAQRLRIETPYFHQFTYHGNRPDALKPPPAKASTEAKTAALQWNPDNWTILLDELSINDGRYRTDRESLTPTHAHFDGAHLDFSGITGTVKRFRFAADTAAAAVSLTAKERSGLHLQTLQTSLRFHPQAMTFDSLLLQTPRSTLRRYFAMEFDKISDMSAFLTKVRLVADMRDASIATDDLALFAPNLRTWKRTLRASGRIRGTVDALRGEGMDLRLGANTALQGNISIMGLPDVESVFITAEARDLRTTYADAVTFVPALRKVKSPNLAALGAIRFRGTYTGFLNDFVSYGTLTTALGTLTTDLNLKLPKTGTPVYTGKISTTGFQLGRFVNNPQLGKVAFNGELRGRGFGLRDMDLTVKGNVRSIQVGTYTYQNIAADGNIKNQKFVGTASIRDPNADLSLAGTINFSGKVPKFDVMADIAYLNTKALQLTPQEINLQGKLNLSFHGSDLSDFLGNAALSNISILQDGKRLSLDSLRFSSTFENGVRVVNVRSEAFDARVTGDFDLASLPAAFTLFLNRYYPAYIKPPKRAIPPQNFTFDITTGVVEDYVKLIDKRLSGFNNSHITGSLNVAANALTLNADVPYLEFAQYKFSDAKIAGVGNLDSLSLRGTVANAIVSDSLFFPQTEISILARNDVSDVRLSTAANRTLNAANIAAQVQTFADGVSIRFAPSTFALNGKTWTIEQGGELDFRREAPPHGAVVLREGTQEIRLNTEPSTDGGSTDLQVVLKNLNLGDLSPFILPKNRLEGIANGTIVVEDPQRRMYVTTDVQVSALELDKDSIGDVAVAGGYNNLTGLLTATARSGGDTGNLVVDLALDLKDSSGTHRDRITLRPTRYPVKILERFIGTLFSDLQGFLTGKLDILEGEGGNKGFDYVGKARLTEAGMRVNFTQVYYRIDDTEIELTEDAIHLGTLTLRDDRSATASVRGSIYHKGFKDMAFDIEAEVDDEPMLLLNTGFRDNPIFYGTSRGNGSFKLTGPLYDMNMYIEAVPSSTDTSYITMPPSRSRETGQASFMVERKYGREMTGEEIRGAASNITYEVNLTATPMAIIEVQLDDLTGDVIRGRGNGNLRIRAGTSEPLTLNGRYDIVDGSYNFSFRSFIRRPFKLLAGANNYIEWSGDPFGAQANFDAVYTASRVSFAPLATSFGLTGSATNARGDVLVLASFKGELFKPQISFRLSFPENSDASNNPSIAFGIQQLQKDPNEVNKQVAFLIATNSFAPVGGTGGINPINELAYNTISGLIFNEINKQLNSLFGKLLSNNNITLSVTGSLYNQNLANNSGFGLNSSNTNVEFVKPLLNGRASIRFEGSVNVPFGSSLQQAVRFLPDVNIEFLLNSSGSLTGSLFYNENFDQFAAGATSAVAKRAGVKFSYSKRFNSLSEILFGKKKGRRKPVVTTDTLPPSGIR